MTTSIKPWEDQLLKLNPNETLAYWSSSYRLDCAKTEIVELRARITEMETGQTILLKDAKRLNWFDDQSTSMGADGLDGNAWEISGMFSSIRDAIDCHMQEYPIVLKES